MLTVVYETQNREVASRGITERLAGLYVVVYGWQNLKIIAFFLVMCYDYLYDH